MLKIKYHRIFLKHYRKRIAGNSKLEKLLQQKINLFLIDNKSPLLKNHALAGAKKGYWAFSLTGDMRVIYTFKDSQTVVFTDIGSHNQVY